MTAHRRRDFRLYFAGQLISTVGSSFTMFGLPLLVFQLTSSAMNLAITTVCSCLPYLLFGLVLGAWTDRTDRRRAMLATSYARGAVVFLIPLLWVLGHLDIWWVYAVAFGNTALGIVTGAVEPTAIAALVDREDLPKANGQIQGSYSFGVVLGPLAAGGLVGGGVPVPWVFGADAASFVVVAVCLTLIRTPFNAARRAPAESVRADVASGLRLVAANPVLRQVAILAGLFNLLSVPISSQLVLYARTRFDAGSGQVSLLYAAGSLGAGLMVFWSGRLVRRTSFRALTLGALTLWGGLILAMSLSARFWFGAAMWACAAGLPVLFSVRTTTLRQVVVPEEFMGRVQSTAMVIAWSAQPIGALVGAAILQAGVSVAALYAGIAVTVLLLAAMFGFGPLGRPDDELLKTAGA